LEIKDSGVIFAEEGKIVFPKELDDSNGTSLIARDVLCERLPAGVSHGNESEKHVADPLAVDSAQCDQMPRGFTRTRGAQPSVELRVQGPRSLISHELPYRLKTVCVFDPKTRPSKLDQEPPAEIMLYGDH
jgi:hypothetical protein